MMLPREMPAFRAIGFSGTKKACLIPLYRDAGITFAQGLFRFDNISDKEFYAGCADALDRLFSATDIHPIILVTVSKTMKKHLILKGAKTTESLDQFVIGGA